MLIEHLQQFKFFQMSEAKLEDNSQLEKDITYFRDARKLQASELSQGRGRSTILWPRAKVQFAKFQVNKMLPGRRRAFRKDVKQQKTSF